nr:reverse transcriptase domain-containing protein [Tanacetum cinerariifolium]
MKVLIRLSGLLHLEDENLDYPDCSCLWLLKRNLKCYPGILGKCCHRWKDTGSTDEHLCSRLVTEGPIVPNPPKSVNPEEDECVEETYTDQDHAKYNIKVPPPPPVQKPKPPIQRNFVLHTRDSLLPHISSYINLMPLSVWKKLGLPDLIPTRMTLELANRAICTLDGIARDVFVPVASYSNHPHRKSVNLINIFNLSSEDCLKDLVSHKQSGNPTFSLHKEIASSKVIHEIHDSKGCTFLSEELPDIDSFNDIHPHFDDDPISGSITYSANSLLEEFADELSLILYPSDYDDSRACNIKSDIREIEFLLFQGEDSDFKDSIDQSVLTHCDDLFVDPTPEMFTNEQPPDYSFPPRFDVYPDDFLEIKFDATFDDDSFDSEGEKIKEAELLIDPLDLPCDILSEYDSFNSQDFSRDDVLPSPDNEDKDFDPPFYELLVFKEVPNSMRLLLFSSENKEKDFKPGIYTSKKFHCCFLPELSHPEYSSLGCSSIPFLSPLIHSSMGGIWSSSFDPKQALRRSIPGFMKILANGFHYLKSSLSPQFNLGITYPYLID